MLLRTVFAIIIVQLVHLVIASSRNVTYTPPDVNLTSCIGEVVVFSITNLVPGGLIYLRTTRGVYKVEPSFDTNGQEYIYQCNFDDCGIEWYEKFTFISQRHVDIQTSHDLHKTFICLADLISIMPGGGSPYEANNTDMVRYLYRASASMTFFDTDGAQLVSGSFVKLGAHVDIYINLTNNIGDMFDLTVKSCDVILLPIISGRCPVDGELFDQFTKLSVGYLYNNFSMFRPTTTVPGAMDVLFSCTLEICRNPCPTYVCNGTEAILVNDTELDNSSRRKRQAVSSTRSRSVKLGTIFRVDYEEPILETPEEKCMSTNTLLAVFTSLGMILLATLVSMVHFIMEWKRQSKPVGKVQTRTSLDKTVNTVSSSVRSLAIQTAVKDNTGDTITCIHQLNNNISKRKGPDIVCGKHAAQTTEYDNDKHTDTIPNKKDEITHDTKRKVLAKMISSPELLHSISNQSKEIRNSIIQNENSDKQPTRSNIMNTNNEGEVVGLNQDQNVATLTQNSTSVRTSMKSALKTSNRCKQEPEQRTRSASEAMPRSITPLQKRPASTSSMQPFNGEELAIHHRIVSEVIAKEFATRRARTFSSASKGSTKSDQQHINLIRNNDVKNPFIKQMSSTSLPLKSVLENKHSKTSAGSAQLTRHLQKQATTREAFDRQHSLSEAMSTEIIHKLPQECIIPKPINNCARETEDKRSRSSSSFL